MKKTISIFFAIIWIYLIVGIVLFIFQRDLLYFPTEQQTHSYDITFFQHDGIKIEVNILNKGKSQAILYFGGNAESVIGNAAEYKRLFPEHSIYLMNYRGYSQSSGSPNEQALYADALFIYDQIIPNHKSISLIGRSLGTAIASYLASKRAIEKLVLITPFDSAIAVAQDLYPVFPISIMLHDKYDSLSRVKEISADTLILIAEKDKIIPRKNTKRLINAFSSTQLIIKEIQNSGHNDLTFNQNYSQYLQEFLNQ